ncbi:hypothetical protein SAMN05444678_102282 [Sphingomonas sp. YR710]|uniref:hypothetical protein n=1 Tax=Sphingomonas sp. YR710 TaxID=1882773 RepID=UPI00088FAB6D|nr:hypothetical protein [Sphingomonas sp. YR710]SDC31567.1 hypothetical protein SAMN05444678_102282 [Sphingomonas sp. YR710]
MRQFVSGTEIRTYVQNRVDADPRLRSARAKILIPMPKPTATESMTGCNWTMHYIGQYGDLQRIADDAVAIVQNDFNIGGPGQPG